MPNRYLRENFIESERINAVGFQAELLWIHLVVTVDDFGRCEASPKLLRPRLFPLRLNQVRETELSRWIAECEKAGLLRLYVVDGKQYLQLEKWEQGRAAKSKYPQPPTDANSGQQMLSADNNGQPPHPTTIPVPTTTTTPIAAVAVEWQGLPSALNTETFKAAWTRYCEYRRERRNRPLGAHSIAEKWAELAALGEAEGIKAIRHSIGNGWTGIFPKDDSEKKSEKSVKCTL